MNLIFLDVDGVLNSKKKLIEVYNKTHKPHSGFSFPFDENCLENLQFLVSQTNSKLVITSNWRKNLEGIEILLTALRDYELDKLVIGYTPILNSNRGTEIKAFISGLKEKPNFIILDDDSDMYDLMPHLVKTDTQVGLTAQNVVEAIKKLNRILIKDTNDFER